MKFRSKVTLPVYDSDKLLINHAKKEQSKKTKKSFTFLVFNPLLILFIKPLNLIRQKNTSGKSSWGSFPVKVKRMEDFKKPYP